MFICANCPCRCEEPCECTMPEGCPDCKCSNMMGLRIFPLDQMPEKTVQERQAEDSQKT